MNQTISFDKTGLGGVINLYHGNKQVASLQDTSVATTGFVTRSTLFHKPAWKNW